MRGKYRKRGNGHASVHAKTRANRLARAQYAGGVPLVTDQNQFPLPLKNRIP